LRRRARRWDRTYFAAGEAADGYDHSRVWKRRRVVGCEFAGGVFDAVKRCCRGDAVLVANRDGLKLAGQNVRLGAEKFVQGPTSKKKLWRNSSNKFNN
jgi:hypothetical protein